MRIGFKGELTDGRRVRTGFIGCGSHAFRNIYPTFQFAPVDLVATCDLDLDKARAFAAQFGATGACDDYHAMIARDDLDAVFIVTGYDSRGRPTYPATTVDCLAARKHVWIEKPPAATVAEIDAMSAAAEAAGKNVLVGMKKMFFPANEKAKALMDEPSFGPTQLCSLQYPQRVPTAEDLQAYLAGETVASAVSFLDHLCHPVSLLLYLCGMPRTLHYERSTAGSAVATFGFESGAVGSITLSAGASSNGGMERTLIVSEGSGHITVDNNIRVTLHRSPPLPYGASPSYFTGDADGASLTWEPEFSLGQLYNKGLFLLGYCGEVNEFACSILEDRPVAKGTLEQARQATRIFEAFAEGPGTVIDL